MDFWRQGYYWDLMRLLHPLVEKAHSLLMEKDMLFWNLTFFGWAWDLVRRRGQLYCVSGCLENRDANSVQAFDLVLVESDLIDRPHR